MTILKRIENPKLMQPVLSDLLASYVKNNTSSHWIPVIPQFNKQGSRRQ